MAPASEPVVCIKNTFIDFAKYHDEDLPRASSEVVSRGSLAQTGLWTPIAPPLRPRVMGDEASEGSTAATAGADTGHTKKVSFDVEDEDATPTSTSAADGLRRTVTFDGYGAAAPVCEDLLVRPAIAIHAVASGLKDDMDEELERQNSLDRTTTYDGFESATHMCMEPKLLGGASPRDAVDQRVHAGWGSMPAAMTARPPTAVYMPMIVFAAAPPKQPIEAQTAQRARSPERAAAAAAHLVRPPQEVPKQPAARQTQDLPVTEEEAVVMPWKGLGLERLSAPGAVVQRFRWVVDAQRLKSSERKAVSPSFNVFFSGPVQFRPLRFEMFIRPQSGGDATGSTSFKMAKGRGCLELKCLQHLSGGEANPVQYRFAVGSLSPGAPARHDFSVKALCSAEEEWDFTADVDPRTRSFAVFLEIVAGLDCVRVRGASAPMELSFDA